MFNIPLININFLKYIREIENVIDFKQHGRKGARGGKKEDVSVTKRGKMGTSRRNYQSSVEINLSLHWFYFLDSDIGREDSRQSLNQSDAMI